MTDKMARRHFGLVWTGALLLYAFEPAVLPSSSAFARGILRAAVLTDDYARTDMPTLPPVTLM